MAVAFYGTEQVRASEPYNLSAGIRDIRWQRQVRLHG